MSRAKTLSLLIIPILLAGCGGRGRSNGYVTVPPDPRRDSEQARRLNAQAVEKLSQDDLEAAEKLLKQSLEADVFFGPGHNNLGTVYFRQQKLYLAAWEFQYAAKLMPNQAQPKNNLGLVFEQVRKYDQAQENYEAALALEPDNPEIIGNLARLYVRTNRKDSRAYELLTELVMKDTRPQWVNWAKQRLATMHYLPECSSQPAAIPPEATAPGP